MAYGFGALEPGMAEGVWGLGVKIGRCQVISAVVSVKLARQRVDRPWPIEAPLPGILRALPAPLHIGPVFSHIGIDPCLRRGSYRKKNESQNQCHEYFFHNLLLEQIDFVHLTASREITLSEPVPGQVIRQEH